MGTLGRIANSLFKPWEREYFSLFEGWPLKMSDLWPFSGSFPVGFCFNFISKSNVLFYDRVQCIHSKYNPLKVRRCLNTSNSEKFPFCIFRHVILLLIYECVACMYVYEPNESLLPTEARRESEPLELKMNMVMSCLLVLGTSPDPLRQWKRSKQLSHFSNPISSFLKIIFIYPLILSYMYIIPFDLILSSPFPSLVPFPLPLELFFIPTCSLPALKYFY